LDLAAKDELVDRYGGRSLLVDKEGPELGLKLAESLRDLVCRALQSRVGLVEGVEEAEEARAILRVEEIAIEEGVESWEDVRIVEIVIPDERPETIEAQKYNDALLVDESLRKSIRRMGLGICEMMRLYWSWVRGSWRRESQADWRARRCD